MTNEEKQDLTNFVRRRVSAGFSCPETVKGLQRLGFKAGTIRKYYKWISEEVRLK
jgi:hypothetical protein